MLDTNDLSDLSDGERVWLERVRAGSDRQLWMLTMAWSGLARTAAMSELIRRGLATDTGGSSLDPHPKPGKPK